MDREVFISGVNRASASYINLDEDSRESGVQKADNGLIQLEIPPESAISFSHTYFLWVYSSAWIERLPPETYKSRIRKSRVQISLHPLVSYFKDLYCFKACQKTVFDRNLFFLKINPSHYPSQCSCSQLRVLLLLFLPRGV